MELNVHYNDVNASHILGEALREIIYQDNGKIVIVCIGSDRVIFDSLGPLVGTLLLDIGISVPIFGSLEDPINSENIEIRIEEIQTNFPNHKVVVIDSGLGEKLDVGLIVVKDGSIKPGAGIDKNILPVGDYVIVPIIEGYEMSEYLSELQIRLRYIFKLAIMIRDSFKYAMVRA